MRFHDFENTKTKLLADFLTKKNEIAEDALALYGGQTNETARAFRQLDVSRQATLKLSNKEILERLLKLPPKHILGGKYKHKCQGDSERAHISAMSEYEWGQLDRPFYNVYPIVEKLVNNTKLKVSAAFLQLPYRTMLFRFLCGHEPYGIKTVLLTVGHAHDVPKNTSYFNADGLDVMRAVAATATVQYVHKLEDDSSHDVFTLAALFDGTDAALDRPYEPVFPLHESGHSEYLEKIKQYQALQSPDPAAFVEGWRGSYDFGEPFTAAAVNNGARYRCLKSLEDTIAVQHDSGMFSGKDSAHPVYMGFQSRPVHEFVFKLALLVAMLHRGDNLIAPIVLSKHQDRYDNETDAAARKWFEDKAAQIQGRGFSVGKELQRRADVSPHIRNPHMALYWTGPGRKEPTFIFRAGAEVMIKKIAQVPTGFMGKEQPNENALTSFKEQVYFLRDPYTGLVKIGRTRQTIAERKKQLETYHGLTLIGYIVTGDCVTLETRLHREYASKRRHRPDGRRSEFFDLPNTEIQAIVARHGGTFCLEQAPD
jgi:hypothetical protein